jgi:hypothetical protein
MFRSSKLRLPIGTCTLPRAVGPVFELARLPSETARPFAADGLASTISSTSALLENYAACAFP